MRFATILALLSILPACPGFGDPDATDSSAEPLASTSAAATDAPTSSTTIEVIEGSTSAPSPDGSSSCDASSSTGDASGDSSGAVESTGGAAPECPECPIGACVGPLDGVCGNDPCDALDAFCEASGIEPANCGLLHWWCSQAETPETICEHAGEWAGAAAEQACGCAMACPVLEGADEGEAIEPCAIEPDAGKLWGPCHADRSCDEIPGLVTGCMYVPDPADPQGSICATMCDSSLGEGCPAEAYDDAFDGCGEALGEPACEITTGCALVCDADADCGPGLVCLGSRCLWPE